MDSQERRDFQVYLTVVKGLANNSVRHTLSRLKVFLGAGGEPTKASVTEFVYSLKQKGLTNNSLNTYVFFFNQYYDFLISGGKECEDFRLDSFKKNKPSIEILTPTLIKKILTTRIEYGLFRGLDCDTLNDRYITFTHLLATTGARLSEVANLQVRHIDFENSKVTFEHTKNREWRKVKLNPSLLRSLYVLTKGKKNDDNVFTSMTGARVSPQVYSADLKKRALAAGITKRVHPHLFRHSFATQLLIRGASLKDIQEICGWKDISTCEKYLHLAQSRLDKTTMRHDLNRDAMPEDEVLELDWDEVQNLLSTKDPRFEVKFSKSKDGFTFRVKKRP